MTYKETLQKLTTNDLKGLVQKMLGSLKPAGTKKEDYINHLLKYTNFDSTNKIIKSKENKISTLKEQRQDRRELFEEQGTGEIMERKTTRIIPSDKNINLVREARRVRDFYRNKKEKALMIRNEMKEQYEDEKRQIRKQRRNKFEEDGENLVIPKRTKRIIPKLGKSETTENIIVSDVTLSKLGDSVKKMIVLATKANTNPEDLKNFYSHRIDINDKLNDDGDTLKKLAESGKIKITNWKEYPIYVVYDMYYKNKKLIPYEYYKLKTWNKREYDFPVFIFTQEEANREMRKIVKFKPARFSAPAFDTQYDDRNEKDYSKIKNIFQILFEDGTTAHIHYTHAGHINTEREKDDYSRLTIEYVDIPVDFQGLGLAIILFSGLVTYATIHSELKKVHLINLYYAASDVGGIVSYNTGCEAAGFFNPIYHRLINKFPEDTKEDNDLNRWCAHHIARGSNADTIYKPTGKALWEYVFGLIIKKVPKSNKQAIVLNKTLLENGAEDTKYIVIGTIIFEMTKNDYDLYTEVYNHGWENQLIYKKDINRFISNFLNKEQIKELNDEYYIEI